MPVCAWGNHNDRSTGWKMWRLSSTLHANLRDTACQMLGRINAGDVTLLCCNKLFCMQLQACWMSLLSIKRAVLRPYSAPLTDCPRVPPHRLFSGWKWPFSTSSLTNDHGATGLNASEAKSWKYIVHVLVWSIMLVWLEQQHLSK